jgi:hypothetical protein
VCHLCAIPVLVTAKEAMMYSTITDWQVEAPESFCENVKTFFEDFKNIGAVNLRFVKTGETLRAL